MPDTEVHEFDVDFEIVAVNESGEVQTRPRQPNVVSRRGHAVKIIAKIRDIPETEGPTEVTLKADVLVLANAVMGEEGDIARPFQRFGRAADVMATIQSRDNLPYTMEIVVPNTGNDDHLGQGPDYQATVDLSTASDFTTSREKNGEDHDPDDIKTGGLFTISFTSM